VPTERAFFTSSLPPHLAVHPGLADLELGVDKLAILGVLEALGLVLAKGGVALLFC